MKKISTVAVKQNRSFSEQKLTIGFDVGDGSSWYCVLDESGRVRWEQGVNTTAKAIKRSVRRNAAQPDRSGNGDAFALGQSVVELNFKSDRQSS
jgi:hypothetical protein